MLVSECKVNNTENNAKSISACSAKQQEFEEEMLMLQTDLRFKFLRSFALCEIFKQACLLAFIRH